MLAASEPVLIWSKICATISWFQLNGLADDRCSPITASIHSISQEPWEPALKVTVNGVMASNVVGGINRHSWHAARFPQ